MKLPRDASGRQVIAALEQSFGYRCIHREGSHVVLQTDTPARHRVTVPDHKALRIGTLNAIVRVVALAQNLPKQEVARRLFA
jgi:predicted RNA binding protein YcfA (HicA-like mRNA interferase family)